MRRTLSILMVLLFVMALLFVSSRAGTAVANGQAEARSRPAVQSLSPAVSPRERTRVLVLGSPHLAASLPASAGSAALGPLLERLERFAPTLIAIERVPGETIETWERLAPTCDALIAAFAADAREVGRAAQAALGVDRREAAREAEAILADLEGPASTPPDESERRRAAMLLVAAYDLDSAALQWSYLAPAERRADETVPLAVASALTRRLQERDERVVLGLALARRLDLQRLESVDDQSDARFTSEHGDELTSSLQQSPEFARLQQSILMTELPARLQAAAEGGDWLDLYRWMNSPEYAAADVDAQWHIFFRTRLASGLDRTRVALWEARNLAITAKLRQASAPRAAARVLVIFGAAHRPFLEAYLRPMMDVEVVAAAEVLGS